MYYHGFNNCIFYRFSNPNSNPNSNPKTKNTENCNLDRISVFRAKKSRLNTSLNGFVICVLLVFTAFKGFFWLYYVFGGTYGV